MELSNCSCRSEALAGTARVTRPKASRSELMELFLCDADVEDEKNLKTKECEKTHPKKV